MALFLLYSPPLRYRERTLLTRVIGRESKEASATADCRSAGKHDAERNAKRYAEWHGPVIYEVVCEGVSRGNGAGALGLAWRCNMYKNMYGRASGILAWRWGYGSD